MKILAKRRKINIKTYALEFLFPNNSCGGFSFSCDEHGYLLPDIMPEALLNYQKCMDGTYDVIPQGVKVYTNSWMEPAHVICSCGEEIVLYDQYFGACECDNCGQWYNLTGQKLNPPEMWEERMDEDW